MNYSSVCPKIALAGVDTQAILIHGLHGQCRQALEVTNHGKALCETFDGSSAT